MKINRKEFLKVGSAAAVCTCAGVSFNGCSMITGKSSTPAAPVGSFALEGKTLEARGWIYTHKDQLRIKIRHPRTLNIISDKDNTLESTGRENHE